MKGFKVFKTIIPEPDEKTEVTTFEHPWGLHGFGMNLTCRRNEATVRAMKARGGMTALN